MGYEFHIVRGPEWHDNPAHQITIEEWQAAIQDDPSLSLDDDENPQFVTWTGPCTDGEALFQWYDGEVSIDNPDEPTLAKLIELAKRMNAKVVGDDGEVYISPTETEPA